ncbi:MAG: glycosyltransferase [Bacteroidales bacterium]|nr:glycosyltransferase [Bacteroidales bacterium]
MKKTLILAYDFPPYVSVGGLRPYSWYKYFHEFDIHPIVVTRQWGNKYGNHLDYIAPGEADKTIIEETEFGTIIRTPYKPNLSNRLLLKYGENRFKLIRKSITAYYEIMQFLFFIGPKSDLYFEAKKYLKNNKVDVIIATGRPFILFKYAAKLSIKFKIPWIADYRDPWSQSSSYRKKYLHRFFSSISEKKIVRSASHITTASEYFKYRLSKLFVNKNITVIGNGYDPDSLIGVNSISQNDKILSIAMLGSLYNWHPIESFLFVLANFVVLEDACVNLNFYGTNNVEKVAQIIKNEYPILQPMVTFYPRMDNQSVLKELASNNVLLLFNYYAFVGTKIFDYLVVNRKILFCYTEEPKAKVLRNKYYGFNDNFAKEIEIQKEIINDTNSGIVIKNEEDLLKVLIDLNREFKETNMIKCETRNVDKYSRKNMTHELTTVLFDLINAI